MPAKKTPATREASTETPKDVESSVSFEQALHELEQIVTRLESGELPLEEALSAFENGVQLARQGQQKLQQAEQRVQILLSDDPDAELSTFTATTSNQTSTPL